MKRQSDIDDGGLKDPHLNSIIGTQRILCCKKLASDEPSGCKSILLYYLKPVGGKLILCCNFDIRKLLIKLPSFYEECLKSFAGFSAANMQSVQELKDTNLILQTILWNNKFICIDGKTVFLNHWRKREFSE